VNREEKKIEGGGKGGFSFRQELCMAGVEKINEKNFFLPFFLSSFPFQA